MTPVLGERWTKNIAGFWHDYWQFPALATDNKLSLYYLANAEHEGSLHTQATNAPVWGSPGNPEHVFALTNFSDVKSPTGNTIQGFRDVAIEMMPFIASKSKIYRVTDDDYHHHNELIPNKLALTVKMTSQQSTYKNIVTNTVYSYEPTHNLLKTTTIENSAYIDVGTSTPVSPQIINETTYAFEDYNSISSKFTDLNMLSAVSQTKQYYGSVGVSNLLKSTVQTWNVDAPDPNSIPRAEAGYAFNNTIDDVGRIHAYVPFNFTNTTLNDSRWQLQNTALEYNDLGQLSLSKNNNVYTKNVLGYNSTQAKASISSTRAGFDATYTGFEDHYNNDIAYELGERKEEEFWYEQNEFDPGFSSYLAVASLFEDELTSAAAATLPFCSEYNYSVLGNTDLYRTFYIDNSNDQIKVGDVITIRPNPDLPDLAALAVLNWKNRQASLDPFTTTVVGIKDLDPIQQVSGTTIVEPSMSSALDVNGVPFNFNENYKHMICFEDDIPLSWKQLLGIVTSNYVGFAATMNGMIIEKTSTPRSSKITNKEAHTGNSSYFLSRKLEEEEPAQRTPVRPVRIKRLGE